MKSGGYFWLLALSSALASCYFSSPFCHTEQDPSGRGTREKSRNSGIASEKWDKHKGCQREGGHRRGNIYQELQMSKKHCKILLIIWNQTQSIPGLSEGSNLTFSNTWTFPLLLLFTYQALGDISNALAWNRKQMSNIPAATTALMWWRRPCRHGWNGHLEPKKKEH